MKQSTIIWVAAIIGMTVCVCTGHQAFLFQVLSGIGDVAGIIAAVIVVLFLFKLMGV